MAIHDFSSQRLFVDLPLTEGAIISCDREQTNYLKNVLRAKTGDQLLVFNGRDGEWAAEIIKLAKRSMQLALVRRARLQEFGPDIDYLFAPLKRARLDYMVQKATEMGVRRLQPVLSERTIARRVNLERMAANAVEAAEQCGILHIPEVVEPTSLVATLDDWQESRRLIFCDESADHMSPVESLTQLMSGPLAVLTGPEGGFSPEERQLLRSKPFVTPIWLGPRIMRADTAAVAALTLVNALLGDWQ